MTRFRLRFPVRQVARWAAAFSDPDDAGIERLAARARRRGCITKADFLRLAAWKTSRSRRRVERNTESFVRAVTRTAMATPEERLRIEVLTLLDGVDWPTASVILHFCHREPYPVLDYRALWSLGVEKPPAYNFPFWRDYTLACRSLAARASCSMRELDRALWQFSKEKQA
ncbi:MAG: hypothetical protein ACM3SU_12290 [Acidobacteriota bacterium]